MTEFEKRLASLKLPSWMDKGEPAKLLAGARVFWLGVLAWVQWPLRQFDPLTCVEPMLNLLAYDRDVSRFNGEPLALFRKRVAYAFVNARDAGSVEGFIAISSGWALAMWNCWNVSRGLIGTLSRYA